MKCGLKVHHTDIRGMLYMRPDALEFALFHGDLGGEWARDISFEGPILLHMA